MMTTAKQAFATILIVSLIVTVGACVSTETGRPKAESDGRAASEQYYQLGAQYLRNGNYRLARDRLLHALSFNPKKAKVHVALGLAYARLQNPRLSGEHYEKAVRYEPDNVDARNAYAVHLCQRKNFDEARKQFDKAIAVRTNDDAEIMLTNAGVCMTNRPDYALAEQYFREALRFKSSYGEALIQMASLKHTTGNSLHGRAFLQRYLASNPTSPQVLYLGMEIERSLEDVRAATDYSNQLLREFPNSAEAKFLLANSL